MTSPTADILERLDRRLGDPDERVMRAAMLEIQRLRQQNSDMSVIDTQFDAFFDWCTRAAQWIQDVVDEAQSMTGRPDDETELMDGRALLAELDTLVARE